MLKKYWQNIYHRHSGQKSYFYLSPGHWVFKKDLLPQLKKYAKGKFLDVGAGRLTYSFFIKPLVKKYVSVDKYKAHPEIDYQADILNLPFKDNQFETVLCSQVLEHIPRPWLAIKELSRVTKKDGLIIITVPHLAYLHEEPSDFYRYTKYGLKQLAREGRLKTIKIIPSGGILSFLFTPLSILFLVTTDKIPLLNKLVFILNKWISMFIVWLDTKIDKRKMFALNYIAIFKKQ